MTPRGNLRDRDLQRITKPPSTDADDLRPQSKPSSSHVEAHGLGAGDIDGVEADDVIGTIAQTSGEAAAEVVVSLAIKTVAQVGHRTKSP